MSNHFPTAADLADDTLATKPHSKLHGDLGDTLSDFVDALGKVDLTGYGSGPVIFDPASTLWDDAGWIQVGYFSHDRASIGVGFDNPTEFGADITSTTLNAWFEAYSVNGGLVYAVVNGGTAQLQVVGVPAQTDPLLDLQDSDGNSLLNYAPSTGGGTFSILSSDGAFDVQGSAGTGGVSFQADGSGYYAGFQAFDATGAALYAKAKSGQTDPLLNLLASDASHIVEVTGDKKIGFYNAAPVALQTGVAVNAAGIHAALVNLGLITA